MVIRRATNEDRVQVEDLVFGVLRSYGLQPDPAATDADLEDIEKHYFESGGWFAVLVSGNRIAGCYGIYPVDDCTCELRKMYLSPEFRGMGFGKRLLEDALTKASELGYGAVTLETSSVLKEAVGLYRKFGFEPHVAEHLSPRCDQAYMKKLE